MPLSAPTTLAVALDGRQHRVPIPAADNLNELKARLQAALGSPVAELRCARTGVQIQAVEEVSSPEDALLAFREASPEAASPFGDDPSTDVPLAVYSQAVALGRLSGSFAVLGPAQSFTPAATAVYVALPAVHAAALLPSASGGRRYILHMGHRVLRGEGEADPGGPLAAEWAISTSKLGAHPSILLPLLYGVSAPPAEALPFLPAPVRSALAGAPAGSTGCLQLLLTEAYSTIPRGSRQHVGALFGHAVDLFRALVHMRGLGVVHRGIRPDVVVLPHGPARLALAGWEHATAVQAPDRHGGGALVCPVAGAPSPAALLGPAHEYAAPEVHACVSAAAAGRLAAVTYDKADVWSAGATLAALALGQHPWAQTYPGAAAGAEVLGATGGASGLRGPACPAGVLATLLGTAVPPAFLALLQYATRPDPSQRITAKAALRRLLELASGRPTPPLPMAVASGFLPIPATAAARFALPGLVQPLAGGKGKQEGAAAEGGGSLGEEADGDDDAMGIGGRPKTAGGGKEADEGDGVQAGEGGVLLLQVLGPDGRPTTEGPGPVAVVGFTASDADTVGAILARACEQLDLPTEASTAAGMSLLWRGERVDPMAPVYRLPPQLRNAGRAGRVLALVPGAAGTAPSIRVDGFGAAAVPPPPMRGPAAFIQGQPSTGGGMGGMQAVQMGAGSVAAALAANMASAATAAAKTAGAAAGGAASGLAGSGSAMAVDGEGASSRVAQPSGSPVALGPTVSSGPSADMSPSLNAAFSPVRKAGAIELLDGCGVAMTRGLWGCVPVHGVSVGLNVSGAAGGRDYVYPRPTCTRYTMSVLIQQLDSGAGVAIGFYDQARFDPTKDFFGHIPGGWAYSRSGKISDGKTGWVEYGEAYGVGDLITADLDCNIPDRPVLRFFKNGVCQGTAYYCGELGAKADGALPLFGPAVTMGSTTGGKTVRVSLTASEAREFDPTRAHYRISFSEDRSTVWNSGKWATVLLAHPGLRAGKLSWHIRLDDTKHGAGVAVGVVDATTFKWGSQNLGASPGSWCYSKTGKKGDGSGQFQSYGKPFTNGDTITVTLDMDAKTLSFAVNGDPQGVAYSAAHGIGLSALVPAVCLGSTDGDKLAKASILGPYPSVRRFSPFFMNPKLTLAENGAAIETREKWGTVFADHPPIRSGKFSFAVQVTSAGQGCGAGIGFAMAETFDPRSRNLGAYAGSWCYSKTGKFSGSLASAGAFEPYGSSFKTGDVVTAEVDVDKEEIRFYLNGHDIGPRSCAGIRALLADDKKKTGLKPAVVLGSSEGGHYTKLTLAPPAVTRFDPRRMNKHMTLEADDRKVSTDFRWCSALADHCGVGVGGILRFAVKLEGEGGAAIGFAEASTIKVYAQNLGASPGTWAISKTGKVSCGDGDGFVAFSEKFGPNDTIGAEADLVDGIIRFWKNGTLLGTAFQGLLQCQEAEWMPKPARPLTLVPAVCLGSNTGTKPSAATFVEFPLDWLR